MENEEIELEQVNIEPKEEVKEQPKKVLKNILKVAISNIFTLLAGILVGFIIPKLMENGDSTADYGYYKIFTLYLLYVGLFHFGFCDGIYLLYGGKSFEELEKSKFRTYSKFFLVFQIIITTIITSIAMCFVKTHYGFIFVFLGINLLAENVTNYYQFISQITGRFTELSFRNIIKSTLTIIAVIVLYILWKVGVITYLQYKIFIVITSSISIALAIWYVITYRSITFGKSNSLKEEKKDIIKLFLVGLPLLIANLVVNLILNIDRQFVSILYDEQIYSSYAFAYNMLNLITTATTAIGIVLYPTLKRLNEEKLKTNYNTFIAIIAMFVAFCLAAYYPLVFIVETWLSKYSRALPVFRVIFPGLMLTSCISMIMLNYYKSIGASKKYFIISIIVLALSFVANLIAYLIFNKPVAISVASVIVMIIWYFVAEFALVRKWKINTLKNILYIALIMVSFYLIAYLINNIFIGFGLYLGAYVLITLIFYFRLIKSKFKFKE